MLDIAKEWAKSMEELLQFDVCSSSSFFDEEGLMISATKINIVWDFEKGKRLKSLKELPPSCTRTWYVVDVMANVRKIKTNDLEDLAEFCDSLMNFAQHTSKWACRIDSVNRTWGLYFMLFRRGEKVVLEIDRKTPLPVEMDRFWPSSRNKANLETLIDRTALCLSLIHILTLPTILRV